MSKHTPGPWEVYPFITSQATGDEVSEAGPDTFVQFRVVVSATKMALNDEISSPADARLMAAAPDLLEALELALPAVAMHTSGGARGWPKNTPMAGEDVDLAAIAKRLRAAIKKATGES